MVIFFVTDVLNKISSESKHISPWNDKDQVKSMRELRDDLSLCEEGELYNGFIQVDFL